MNNQILKSARFRNFRSYKDSFIEFHSGLNALTGENDSGKTNSLRAIDWTIRNRPLGDDIFPLYWEGNPHIELDIGNKIVGRYKSKTENLYTLSGHKEPFKSFGKGVPEIIKQHLNLSSVNMASQFKGMFLLDKSPSDVAKHYNSVVNLDIIDTTISNISSTLRKERAALEVEKTSKKEKEKKLKQYDWLPAAELELKQLEKLQNYLKKLKGNWSILCDLIREYKRLDEINQSLEEITKHDKIVTTLLNQKKEIDLLENDYQALADLIDNFKELTKLNVKLNTIVQYESDVINLLDQAKRIKQDKEDIRELKYFIARLIGYQKTESQCQEVIKYTDEVNRLIALDNEIEKDTDKYNSLLDLAEKHNELSKTYATLDAKINKLEKEFKELMPEICPLCGKECDCNETI